MTGGDDFLAGASDEMRHRLNNLLARIVALAECALDSADEPGRVRALMEDLIGIIERPGAAQDMAPEPSGG